MTDFVNVGVNRRKLVDRPRGAVPVAPLTFPHYVAVPDYVS